MTDKHSETAAPSSKTDLIQYLWVCVDLAGQKGGDGLAYVSPVELRRAIELLGAVETTVHDIPLQKPCVEWPDVAAAIHALYDEPREGHRGCGEIALAAAKEIERLRPAVEPSPPHPGPSIEKAFTNSPRRVEPTRRIPPREFDIESHTGLYTEPAARKATYRDIYPNDPTWWKEGMTSPWFELPSTLPEKASGDVSKMRWDACSEGGLWVCQVCDEAYASPPWSRIDAAKDHINKCRGRREPL